MKQVVMMDTQGYKCLENVFLLKTELMKKAFSLSLINIACVLGADTMV